ncbi:MAG: PAS domain S-box protein [Planctomycetes bacterium]|nr:PAS domain S-box protein [Planctomycetota bacterium]
MSIRTKLTLFMSFLIVTVSVVCCTIFYLHDKREHSEQLIKFGSSLVSLLSQDNDIKLAITANQPAFLEAPIKSAYSYDIDKEVAYWKVMNTSSIIKEEKSPLYDLQLHDIPGRITQEGDTAEIKIKFFKTSDGKTFYDVSLPVKEKRMLTEEEFAAHVFGEEHGKSIIGFVQIGLSTHVLNERLNHSFLSVIIPVGVCILFGGFCIVFFLNKYFVKPIKNIADVSLEIAEGNLGKRLKVYSHDEIGTLTKNFNQMTLSLEQSYSDLKQEVTEHKHTSHLLQHQLNVEEIIATVSTNFISYVSGDINTAINSALLTIGAFLGVDRVFLFLYKENNNAFVANTNEWRRGGVASRETKSHSISTDSLSFITKTLQKNEVITTKTIKELPVDLKSELEVIGFNNSESIIIVSLMYGNSFMGFLGCDVANEEKEWSHHDISLLKVISEIFTNAFEHKRKEEMLQKAHDELENRVKERTIDLLNTNVQLEDAKNFAESLIETANVMVIGLNKEGIIHIVNKTTEELTGYTKKELIGQNFFDILVPKGRYHYFWDIFRRWSRGKGDLLKIIENPIVTKTGLERYISWQNSEITEHEIAVGSISFGVDITDQKLMNTLVERMRLTSIVKDISMVFNQGIQLKDKLKKCTETIVANLHVDCAGLWMLNETDDVLELKAFEGNIVDIEDKYGRIPLGRTNIGLIAKNTLPYITNNFIDAIRIRSNELEEKEEPVSFAGFPLATGGRVFGVVALFTKNELNNFVVRALASVADIISLGIDRERNVDALRTSENKYRVLLENLPQKIFHKDRESVYVSCNENYARDIGIMPEEIKGKTDYDFFPKSLAEKYRRDDQRIMKSGMPEEFEEKYVVEGREYVIQTAKTPVKDETGKITGILGIFWDITEKIQLQMEATRSRHMASLGELAAGVAHEINNPINGIINYAQILANKSGEQSKEKDIANRIKKESIRIANIVKSLLSFAMPGEYHNVKKSVHVEEILTDTFILTEAQIYKEGIEMKLNLPKTLPEITVNAQQIQQVFLNLLSNARYALNEKYKEGHENKVIEISGEKITQKDIPCVRITFADHGIGIPANMLDKVMDPFFTLKPKGIGTGLGLSICHRIISEHGGKLTIESVEGEFTKLIIVLPAVVGGSIPDFL